MGSSAADTDRRPPRRRRPRSGEGSPPQAGAPRRREIAVPAIGYPPELPISRNRDRIAELIRDHQVVVVAGETGSGKTTQLPKICLELGRGRAGMIGHTQPRRIAARSVAERVAEELGTELGGIVGYAVRFTDQVGPDTLVKLMTDGILLAEIQRDPQLLRYDTIIIDEAHERSLTIDFLIGYLSRLLPRRPDLKLVITSATIDVERFARHFGDAPVIEVSGRSHPVEVRYRPLVEDVEDDDGEAGTEVRDQVTAISDAVRELCGEGDGDILVFLSGEREIRDTADALGRLELPRTEILPLYARLSAAEQHRVFASHPGRRIVLATNVAETSLTVPGIRYVVDPGTARISRYSTRLKVQRLPIEPISQASANQRAGRCGRVAPGICIRLYGEEDFAARPEFTDPEVQRTNLASVILQMTAMNLGDVASFPFLDPPDARQIKDGYALLVELGALEHAGGRYRLTRLGRRLSQLPVDPRLGRMILEADRHGCVREVIVLAAALSIQDPRERPTEKQEAAETAHRRFAHAESDFQTLLNLWEYLRERQRELSSSAFRRLCRNEFLNYLRVREWQDLVGQLRRAAASVGLTVAPHPVDADAAAAAAPDLRALHTALASGLLSHLGMRDRLDASDAGQRGAAPAGQRPQRGRAEYLGARGAKFAIFPGSGLARRQPDWVIAAELVETSRLWGRVVGRVEPEWLEPLAAHLVKRNYSEPHWSRKRASVVATEKVTLYGLPLVAARTVQYGRIDPELSRELFLRHALVEGDWDTRHRFFTANRELLAEVEDLENRSRRRDLMVDDQVLFDFYDARVPAEVVSGRHFDTWWKQARREQPDLLTLTAELVVADDAAGPVAADYPDHWRSGDLELPLGYQFEPGTAADGVSVRIPLAVLNRAGAEGFDWQVPGLREELATALIRGLPKATRRNFVPAPDHARKALALLPAPDPERAGPFHLALGEALAQLTGVPVPPQEWAPDQVPDHLRVTYVVVDDAGRELGADKDLAALRRRLAPRVRAEVARAGVGLERTGLRRWEVGDLPEVVTHQVERGPAAGQVVRGYPALVDRGDSVALQVLDTPAAQAAAMGPAVRRLLRLELPSPVRSLVNRLDRTAKLALAAAPHPSPTALFDDCLDAALDALIADQGGPPRTEAGYRQLLERARGELQPRAFAVLEQVARVLAEAAAVDRALSASSSLSLLDALSEARAHLNSLVHPGFVAEAGAQRLPDLVRYLQAARRRLETLPEHPQRDRALIAQLDAVRQAYARALAALPPGTAPGPELAEVRWMLEELRLSYFAQQLRTRYPVSDKRVLRAITAAAAGTRPAAAPAGS